MSNELVYGDASKFVANLQEADARAREFFAEVVTYLSGCVKNLSLYRESLALEEKSCAAMCSAKIESTDDSLKLTTNFALLHLLSSHPPGTVRFLLEERVSLNSPFHPRGVEGHLSFSGEQRQSKGQSQIERVAEGGSTSDKKKPAPAIFATEGFLPPAFKTDSAAAFAEPLFWQLFQPLPVEAPAKTNEARA
jgi:hypothetical protein